MINYLEAKLKSLSIHQIDFQDGLEPIYADSKTQVEDHMLREMIYKFFFGHFKNQGYYSFKKDSEFSEVRGDDDDSPEQENSIQILCEAIFEDPGQCHEISKEILNKLIDASTHPNIKTGDVIVGYVNDVVLEDELCDAICIVKSENKDDFIKINRDDSATQLDFDSGINVGKIDKACIILNLDAKSGYKIMALDRSNPFEAKFWMENFLNLGPYNNDYNQTKEYMKATKSFIKEKLVPDEEFSKMEEMEILNRSSNFFKLNEGFDQKEFATAAFPDEEQANQFGSYVKQLKTENEFDLSDQFEISPEAFKNYSRVLKSVIKLDKNFSVYVHGDRSKIERGQDEMGRKFYKIYYEQEK